MTIDFDDAGLEQRLTTQGQRFQSAFVAPDLGPMLTAAVDSHRRSARRWLLPALAAVLLLAIPLITVIALHRQPHSAGPATPRPDSPLPSNFVEIGKVSWLNPVAYGSTLQVTSSLTSAQSCDGPPEIRAQVTATSSTSVTVVVTAYRNTDPAARTKLYDEGCADKAHGIGSTLSTKVDLGRPLGRRAVIDGLTETRHSVLDADDFPTLTALPPGFDPTSGFQWNESEPNVVSRTWSDSAGELSLTRELYPGDLDTTSSWPQSSVATGTVLGHFAKYQIWGTPHVSWMDGKYLYTVGQMPFNGVGTFRYDMSALFRFANSMR